MEGPASKITTAGSELFFILYLEDLVIFPTPAIVPTKPITSSRRNIGPNTIIATCGFGLSVYVPAVESEALAI